MARRKSRKSERKRSKRPAKRENLLDLVRQHVDTGSYLDTRHVVERKQERDITLPEVLQVLRRGFWEKRKDEYKMEHPSWNYAIRGKTVDGRELRVIVAFLAPHMLLITAIDLNL